MFDTAKISPEKPTGRRVQLLLNVLTNLTPERIKFLGNGTEKGQKTIQISQI